VTAADRGVAVAVGGEVVPKAEWATTVLADGATVEVVRAAAGGQETYAMPDPLTIAGQTFTTRLMLGSGGFTQPERLAEALAESGSEIVTVAIRRVENTPGGLYDVIARAGARLLP